MASARRLLPVARFLLVAAAGALIGHEIGYGLRPFVGEPGVLVGHAHVGHLVQALVPFGAVALLAGTLADPRRTDWARDHLGLGRLTVTQSLLYAALEVGERVAQDASLWGLLSPHVILGAVAQLVVAAVLVTLVRDAQRLRALLVRTAPPSTPQPPAFPTVGRPFVAADVQLPVRARAPPLLPAH